MDDTATYRELFFEETDEYLQTLNDCVLELEQNPNDKSTIEEIFRAAHTLKGMAATMGYNTMTELTHSMENVFELFRNGTLEVNSQIITTIFDCLDMLSEIVEDLREEKYLEYDISHLLKELSNISNKEEKKQETQENPKDGENNIDIEETDIMIIERAREKDYKAFNITVKLVDYCVLKGARAYLIVNKLEQQGDIIKTNPSPEKLEIGEFKDTFQLIYLSKEEMERVKELVENNAEIEKVSIEEINIEQGIEEQEAIEEVEKTQSNMEQNAETKSNKKTEQKTEERHGSHHMNQSIRVDINRLDSFMNLVSELVIYRTRLEDLSSKYTTTEINEPLEHVARITSELQDLVLKIRMEPVSVVLNRFPRMIRDLSKELDKEIQLVIEGEETELDRTVISELGEPLVHLLRNAAGHGIEHVDERLALGKDKVGLIKLTAYQEGDKVVISLSDDGKGLDPQVIKASAERKGISTEGMSNRDLIQLIFNPGFSTAKEVTNVSGRGVGMDVVKQKIASLGGSIDVISEVNKGTTFIIKLPLTLSIIQALMVNVGQETFALPLGIIETVVKVNEGEIFRSHKNEVYIYREKAIPIIRVSDKLSIESKGDNEHLIIILLGDQHYGLLVDGLIGQQEIVIKKLSGLLAQMKEYIGATILGNGDITLILDVGNLCTTGKGDNVE